MGTLLPLSGNLTTSDIAEYWENLLKPKWVREYSCTIGIDFASEPTIVPYRTK